MSPENEPRPKFCIAKMTADDIESATLMRAESWLDTYINDEIGVTREWIVAHNIIQLATEKNELRKERLGDTIHHAGWVAKDLFGKVIGSTTPYIDENGRQDIGSMYVEKNWHGKGVASALMQKAINWFDATQPIELGVVQYNERAKAFYRKWGFEEVAGSEKMFADKIPSIIMIRKGEL